MFCIAFKIDMNDRTCCAETRVYTGKGYQIFRITDDNGEELFFVCEDFFLKKYKNVFIFPEAKDRLYTFEETRGIYYKMREVLSKAFVKESGGSRQVVYNTDNACYDISLKDSDISFTAKNSKCNFIGSNNNFVINTDGSEFTVKTTSSSFTINATNTCINLFASNCYFDLAGLELNIILIGNNNVINGLTDNIMVITRGKGNEFHSVETFKLSEESKE